MSDGLQAMINLVSEIAHRCIELNGCLGNDAIHQTPGVIMIDKVDVFLHPHWQKHVLQDLVSAFPKIQFIVSTHSPFIVQSLQAGQPISFDENIRIEGEPSRESPEDITSERMGLKQNIRSKRFKEMVDTASNCLMLWITDQKTEDEFKARLDQIEADFSNDPAYVAAVKLEGKACQ